jgi:hypothetical protein
MVYGKELKEWITRTAESEQDSIYRIKCPDFSFWNDIGPDFPDVKLEGSWCWDFNTHCTPEDTPEMKQDGYIAYFPMRQMPCCGIARREDGTLEPFGALPDEKDADGNWVWDDGSIRRALTTSV